MDVETINIEGVDVPHGIYRIPGDGNCLFSSLAYLVHGTDSLVAQMRADVVRYVCNNWRRLKPSTMTQSGAPYKTKPQYISDMSQAGTYGTTFELMVAAEMFPYQFQVFGNGVLIARFGEPTDGIRRLKFSGHFNSGHFDVLIPLEQRNIMSSVIKPLSPSKRCEAIECVPSVPLATFEASSDESIPEASTKAEGKRGRKRRKRFTDSIRKKQIREAVSKYNMSTPETNRKAVKKYSQNHPDINKEAVVKYAKNNPYVNRAAVCKYNNKRLQIKAMPWTVKHLSGYNYDPKIDYLKDKMIDIGSPVFCTWCKAKKWKEESPGMCCSNGKVQIPGLQRYPEPLHSLLTNQHSESEHFLSALRKYNGCFQMTSFGAKEVKEGNFMPTFKVQGQVYHLIGSLLPPAQQQPSFLQIYFVGDDDNERNIRCANFPGVKPELIGQLQKLLHHHNKYIKEFKAAVESVPVGQEDFQVLGGPESNVVSAHANT